MKSMMRTITISFILTIFALSTCACDKKQQEVKPEKQEISKQEAHKGMSTAALFESKCTSCHDTKRAEDMHASKESFVEIVKRMIKKGANISSNEEKEISEFLAAPSRFLMKEKCSKCHTLDRIYDAHEKGQLTKETLKNMQKKEGSEITEKEVDSIYEGLNSYYFVSPQIPMGAGF